MTSPFAAPAFDGARLQEAVAGLRSALQQVRLPLDVPGVRDARAERGALIGQLDDYVIPRVASLDAPLLAVIGGSTGAGKSTLVNSIVGAVVSRSGVLRPTTRASVLVHNPADERWFTDRRILPNLGRLSGATGPDDDPGAVRLVGTSAVPQGIALLDAPDIDSVVAANRDLARQLLLAADLWLFVTTAARYADAVPWEVLRQAAQRGTSVAIVLDRVPREAVPEIHAHLREMLRQRGLGAAPIFTVTETQLGPDGLVPVAEVQPLRDWLGGLANDARARQQVIRQTLTGALDSLSGRIGTLASASLEQYTALKNLHDTSWRAYDEAIQGVTAGMDDGTLLRGEVLARWHELVGTGELFRQIESGVGRVRDRIAGFFRGKGNPVPAEDLGEALQTGVAALLTAQAQGAASNTTRQWRTLPGGSVVLDEHPELARSSEDLERRVDNLVRQWQGQVLELVRAEAGSKRTTARFLAFGVNGIAVMLMLVVFASTAGLSGAEVGIAGGSAVLAQRLLEAVFGDQAVRSLAARARASLLDEARELYAAEQRRYDDVLLGYGVQPQTAQDLTAAVTAVQAAR
ncbi:ABC transporter [Epidermidibacterium keratini]|uniref:ABC transporter n=1 Tax=Epidermidibacterium keratini TaxID=1891644 RepID=A0A7L4YMW6_9ACTN|nr:ABC transporter [Epidermidibacterium keratini]QHC00615.1 ABC transporter [Epidermidibacterium keratini]